MAQILCTPRQFGPSWVDLQAVSDMEVSADDLLWAAITVGKREFADILQYGWFSYHDACMRMHQVAAYLEPVAGRYRRSPLYNAADPSEKRSASFFLGMCLAKIFASRHLETDWLMHVSRFDGRFTTPSDGASMPDFVGEDRQRRWVVVEAKGRSNGLDEGCMSKAKSQLRRIRRVNGQFPHVRVATQALFGTNLELVVQDPDLRDRPLDIEVRTGRLLQNYYATAASLLFESFGLAESPLGDLRVASVGELGVEIGLLDSLVRHVKEPDALAEQVEQLRRRSAESVPLVVGDHKGKLLADGVFVAVGPEWSDYG